MYRIIGSDGSEYGPVSPETIRQWISEGRLSEATQARPEHAEKWNSLGSFAEFAGLFPTPSVTNPARATVPGRIDPLECFGLARRALFDDFWPYFGCVMLAILGPQILSLAIQTPFGLSRPLHSPPLVSDIFDWRLGVNLALGFLVSVPLNSGVMLCALRRSRGQEVDVRSLFAGFSRHYLPLVAASFLVTVFSMAGLVLCVLPGIWLLIAYSMTYLLILDKGLGFWDAMETSRKAVQKQWWAVAGVTLLSVGVVLLGMAALCVGVFIAVPLIFIAQANAYRALFGDSGAGQ